MSGNFNTCPSNLVSVSGLCNPDNTTEVIRKYPYWKQMYLSESLEVPAEKPDIEQINSVTTSVNILRKEVIVTPRSYMTIGQDSVVVPNLEGKRLSGRKLIIEGQLCQMIEYTAALASQPVHSAEFFVPFSSYIVVPEKIVINAGMQTTEVDSLDVQFDVNACLEDVTVCAQDARRILKQVTLLLSAVPLSAN